MLLFFDIDGTIFDEERRLPASVKPAMEKARENGHRLFINTGRTLCNMGDERLASLPFDGRIMGCGTRIEYHGETMQALEADTELSERLRDMIRTLALPVVYECDTGIYYDPETPSHPEVTGFRAFSDHWGISRDIRTGDPEFRMVKMFVFTDDPAAVRRLEAETAALGFPYCAVDRGHSSWEMIPAGYTKATGMETLCRILGTDIRDTVAFGDSTNDRDMLRRAGISVAMGNAPDEVKAECTLVTERPEEDGIRRAMEKLKLI